MPTTGSPTSTGSETDSVEQLVHTSGFAIRNGILSRQAVLALRTAIAQLEEGEAVRKRRGVYAIRNLLEVCTEARRLACAPAIADIARRILGEGAFAVRGTFFDKVPDANWVLGYHQDSVIAVRERYPLEGFSAWSQKAGVWQAQPPVEILAQMVAIRVHLDDCLADNGALRVLPGSHLAGWLDGAIETWKERSPEVVCEVRAGGIVAMRPLLLHASSPSSRPSHRRVVHIEYAAAPLPPPLEWQQTVRA